MQLGRSWRGVSLVCTGEKKVIEVEILQVGRWSWHESTNGSTSGFVLRPISIIGNTSKKDSIEVKG